MTVALSALGVALFRRLSAFGAAQVVGRVIVLRVSFALRVVEHEV